MDSMNQNEEQVKALEAEAVIENVTEENSDITVTDKTDETELIELAEKSGLGLPEHTLDDQSFYTTDETDAAVEASQALTEEQQQVLMASMEAVLFMSDKPVSLPKLRSIIDNTASLQTYRQLMSNLKTQYEQGLHGIEIAEVSLGFQFRTKSHMSSVLRKMVKTQPLKLSNTNMEVLAITAYKQPITKDELDQIRGVDNGYVLRNLMEKRLVRIVGRSDLPGRPMLYGTTHEFLELFSLKDIKAMPPLHEIEAMVAASEIGNEEKSAEQLKEFSKIVENSKDQMLFGDGPMDEEIESLRAEIAAIPTSTPFIEEQKFKEKKQIELAQKIAEGSVPAGTTIDQYLEMLQAAAEAPAEAPAEASKEEIQAAEAIAPTLETATSASDWEQNAAMIAQAVEEGSQNESQSENLNESDEIPAIEASEPPAEALPEELAQETDSEQENPVEQNPEV